jgi:hypothetical protein
VTYAHMITKRSADNDFPQTSINFIYCAFGQLSVQVTLLQPSHILYLNDTMALFQIHYFYEIFAVIREGLDSGHFKLKSRRD